MQQERLIRKYSNRRLYDTSGSRHVTLDDLRQMIVAGERIKVVDDKSGEDLTRSVLLQIIAEQEQFGLPVLGADLLEMIIRFYGGPMQALLSRYLEQAFTTMLRQQEAMQSEMAKALQTPFAPLTELARKKYADVGADAGSDPQRVWRPGAAEPEEPRSRSLPMKSLPMRMTQTNPEKTSARKVSDCPWIFTTKQ